jgi:hypothetical protein
MRPTNGDDTKLYARCGRQLYARHLYCLMMALLPEPSGTADVVMHDGQGDATDSNDSETNNNSQTDRQEETARAIAQWAINVVDFRDPDSIMTPFEYDVNPFDADGWDIDIDGLLHTNEVTLTTAPDRRVVWGCERPELLITETLAMHDVRTEDLPAGNGRVGEQTDPAEPLEQDYDQRLRPRGYFFAELFNPNFNFSSNPSVQLDATDAMSGTSPVWRMVVTEGRSSEPDEEEIDTSLLQPEIVVTPNSGLYTSEYLSPYTLKRSTSFTVKLNTQVAAGEVVIITITSDDTTEGVISSPTPAELRFDSSNWDQPETVVVTGVDDADNDPLYDGDVPYTVTLQIDSGRTTSSFYQGLDPSIQQVHLVNWDNDDMDHVKAADRPDILRSIYFTKTGGPADGEVFHRHPEFAGTSNLSLSGGAYAVIGPSGQEIELDDSDPNNLQPQRRTVTSGTAEHRLFTSFFGRRTDAMEVMNGGTGLNYDTTRRIVFENPWDDNGNAASTPSDPVGIFQNNNPSCELPDSENLRQLAVVIGDQQWPDETADPVIPRWLNISEPTDDPNYDANFDPTLADYEGAYVDASGEALDTPFELEGGIPAQIGTYWAFRNVHLQRLANPLRPYDATTNPYITVDTASVPLHVFNGVSNPADLESDGGTPPTFDPIDQPGKFYAVQRGDRDDDEESQVAASAWPEERTLWIKEHEGNLHDKYASGLIANHYFDTQLTHSLGHLNDDWDRITPSDITTFNINSSYLGAPRSFKRSTLESIPGYPPAWLAWNNWAYSSPLDLMLVPRSRSSRLLFWDHSVDFATKGFYNEQEPRYGHLLNFFHTRKTDPSNTSESAPPMLHRLFEYVEIPSPYLGTRKWYDPEVFSEANPRTGWSPPLSQYTTETAAHDLRPPFNSLSRFRDPGRININTIFDNDIWGAINKGYPAANSTSFANAVWLSRQGYGTATTDLLQLSANYPSRFANPFRSKYLTGTLFVDPMPKDQTPLDSQTGEPTTSNLRKDSVESTLLRSYPTNPSAPLFAYNPYPLTPPNQRLTECYKGPFRNPVFRYEGLKRLPNLLTTRSNVFALWITIGYFEVTPGTITPAVPDGYRLEREIGAQTGEIRRHRAFYLIDRSIPVGFEPGQNYNVDRAVLVRRFIE